MLSLKKLTVLISLVLLVRYINRTANFVVTVVHFVLTLLFRVGLLQKKTLKNVTKIKRENVAMFPSPSDEHQAFERLIKTLMTPKPTLMVLRARASDGIFQNLFPEKAAIKKFFVENVDDGSRIEVHKVVAEGVPGVVEANSTVMLFYHGGGHVSGSPERYKDFTARLSKLCHMPVFNVGYRLCPEHPFKCQLSDSFSAYSYLTRELNIPPSQIVICGDSAGGGLALATLQRIVKDSLPPPRCGVLICPYADFTLSGKSHVENAESDVLLSPEYMSFFQNETFPKRSDEDLTKFSAINSNFSGLPPLYICASETEVLYDDAVTICARARSAGVKVFFESSPYGVHVYPVFCKFAPEYRDALSRIANFINTQIEKQKSFIN